MKRTDLGAAFWILCLQYFAGESIAIGGWPGRYSLSDNFISDLGAVGCDAARGICSPLNAVMNASFLLQGLLILGGAILVGPLFPTGTLWRAALFLVGASGIGVFVVGLAPEDVWPGPHYLGAAENLALCNLGMATMGVALLRWRPETRAIGLISIAAGLLGLLGVILLSQHMSLGLGIGAIERVAAYPFPIWIAATGAMLLWGGELTGRAR